MFSQACIIPSVRGGCLPLGPGGMPLGLRWGCVHPLDTHTPEHTPPGHTHPPYGTHTLSPPPRDSSPLDTTVKKRTVRILLECFLVAYAITVEPDVSRGLPRTLHEKLRPNLDYLAVQSANILEAIVRVNKQLEEQ